MADALSRLPLPSSNAAIEDDQSPELIATIAALSSSPYAITPNRTNGSHRSCTSPSLAGQLETCGGDFASVLQRTQRTFSGGGLFNTSRAPICHSNSDAADASWTPLMKDTQVRAKRQLRLIYWWPGMDSQVEHHVKHSIACQDSEKSHIGTCTTNEHRVSNSAMDQNRRGHFRTFCYSTQKPMLYNSRNRLHKQLSRSATVRWHNVKLHDSLANRSFCEIRQPVNNRHGQWSPVCLFRVWSVPAVARHPTLGSSKTAKSKPSTIFSSTAPGHACRHPADSLPTEQLAWLLKVAAQQNYYSAAAYAPTMNQQVMLVPECNMQHRNTVRTSS